MPDPMTLLRNMPRLQIFCPLLLISSISFSADNTLINLSSDEQVDNSNGSFSFFHGLSENGEVAFSSGGTNLVPNDFNGETDVFVRDVENGITEIISLRTDGSQSNGSSSHAEISDDGRWVLFWSDASNLDRPDNDNSPGLARGIYLRDRDEGTTVLIANGYLKSPFPQYGSSSDMSSDASVITFSSSNLQVPGLPNSDFEQVYLYYRLTDELVLVSQRDGEPGDFSSQTPRISADGTRVTYSTYASNLIENPTSAVQPLISILLYDTDTNSTEHISTGIGDFDAADSSFRPTIDDAGRYVSFASSADNLVADDNNNENDVFVRDTLLGTTELVSISNSGNQGNGSSDINMLTGDGTGIVFTSGADNLIVDDGRFFRSTRNVYYKSFDTQKIELVSAKLSGRPVQSVGSSVSTNGDGRYVVFQTSSTEMVPAGVSGSRFVYLRDRGAACAGNTSNLEFTLKQLNWELLSLPCLPPGGATVETLFADDLPGTYITDWVIYTFDPLINDYRRASLSQAIAPGQGFWIIQGIAPELTLQLPENSRAAGSNFDESDNCVSDTGCRSLPLVYMNNTDRMVSWNLIGSPFSTETNVAIDDMRVVTPVGVCIDGCTLDEAFNNETALNFFYRYDSDLVDYVPVSSGDSIGAWSGLWVAALENATMEDTRVVVPE